MPVILAVWVVPRQPDIHTETVLFVLRAVNAKELIRKQMQAIAVDPETLQIEKYR